jgi:hypothetical protein
MYQYGKTRESLSLAVGQEEFGDVVEGEGDMLQNVSCVPFVRHQIKTISLGVMHMSQPGQHSVLLAYFASILLR